MSATDYTIDQRDFQFVLFEQLKVQDLCNLPGYKEFSKEDFEMIINEAIKFAREVIGPTNHEGDQIGAKLVDGQVHLPPSFKSVFTAYCEAGWVAANGQPKFGGQGLPHSITCSLADIFTGANTSFFLNAMLAVGVAHVLEKYGAEWMQNLVIPKLYTGEWGGTMVLTEPSAGSDVGAAKTKAVKVEGTDYYHVSGTKIFITGGDHDLTENIVHLVLARTPGAPAGTKGLSLFIVPKYRFTEAGGVGESNDVACVGIEHKMGIKASATCQLAFGEKGDCRGYIVGQEMDGIKMMFNMMNEARIEVGLQGCSLTNAAYQNALAYARERVQGSSIREFKNPDAPKVTIIEHPDVRRQLLTIKAFGEGMRSLLHSVAFYNDLAHHAEAEEDRAKYNGFVELLTPICKAYCTDRGVDMTSMAIQVFGGYGYTQDYPAEQYMRDVKIGCIYEGTNSIQSLDLLARKLAMKKGMIFMSYTFELDRVKDLAAAHETIASLAPIFGAAKDRLVEVAMNLGGWGMQGRLELATARATMLLDLMGDVVMANELLKAAAVAEEALKARGVALDDASLTAAAKESSEVAFYAGKLHNARFFCNVILPRTEGWAKGILSEDLSHMNMVF